MPNRKHEDETPTGFVRKTDLTNDAIVNWLRKHWMLLIIGGISGYSPIHDAVRSPDNEAQFAEIRREFKNFEDQLLTQRYDTALVNQRVDSLYENRSSHRIPSPTIPSGEPKVRDENPFADDISTNSPQK